MRSFAILVAALVLTVSAASTARADQTITISVPVNLTNIPTKEVGYVGTSCAVYPPSVQVSSLATWGGGDGNSVFAVGSSQAATLTSSNYSGTFSVPLTIPDVKLVGVTQPLPYQCVVLFWTPSSPPSPSANELLPAQLLPLFAQSPNAMVRYGTIPFTTGVQFVPLTPAKATLTR